VWHDADSHMGVLAIGSPGNDFGDGVGFVFE